MSEWMNEIEQDLDLNGSLSLLITHGELFQLWALCEQKVECLAPKEHSIPQKLFFGWVVYDFLL